MKFKKGVSTISVEKVWDEQANKFLVKKKFQTKNKYERERDFYIHYGDILSYIPRLFRFDDVEKIIWTEYCGISLNLKYQPKDRYRFKAAIKAICNNLKSYGLYHNDIRWKNIVENEDGKLFLIDFEVISTDNKERDPENILTEKHEKNSNSIRTSQKRLQG
jgi:thiamine kinase-like enzyme